MSQQRPLCDSFGTLVSADPGETLDDLSPETVSGLLAEAGAVVFRGFAANEGAFQRFSARHSGEFLSHGIDNRPQVKEGDQSTYQANVGHFPLVLHAEMSYFPVSPDLLWFACVRPAAADGETTLCDGAAIHDAMTDEQREFFANRRLMYAYPSPIGESTFFGRYRPDELQSRLRPGDSFEHRVVDTEELLDRLDSFYPAPVAENLREVLSVKAARFDAAALPRMVLVKYLTPAVRTTRHGGRRAFVNSALQFFPNKKFHGFIYAEDGSRLPADMMEAVQRTADRLTHPLAWQAGDVALIDNSRVLHGRRAFEDKSREIHTRMAMAAG